MFDPSLHKAKEEEVKRSLGHTKAGFRFKPKGTHGYTLKDAETQESIEINKRPPNRKERRAYLSLAPRSVKQAARRRRETYIIAHKPWTSYPWQYFPPEEIINLNEGSKENRDAAKRYVKNMLKRKRRDLRAS